MCMRHSPKTANRGVSLVEITVSTLIVGAMAVAALNALGAATRSSVDAGRRGIATTLAAELMTEILSAEYIEPDSGGVFGPETDEAAEGNRSLFDDVDDYHAWQASPPQDKPGAALPDRADWRRQVAVEHVEPGDLTNVLSASNDQGVKRITIEVYHEETLLHRLRAYTTSAW
jgi:Tfp pilus assembly protein PilV